MKEKLILLILATSLRLRIIIERIHTYLKPRLISKIFAYFLALFTLLFIFGFISYLGWLVGSISCAIPLAIAYLYQPVTILQFSARMFIYLLYKLKLKGSNNIPKEGGGILICNHISFIDFLVHWRRFGTTSTLYIRS